MSQPRPGSGPREAAQVPVAEVAREVLRMARSRRTTLGAGRLICVEGPGGSGKTTLATALLGLEPGARVVHMDDLYAGWSGLGTVADQLETLLSPLAAGSAGSYRRYDWHAQAFAETVVVDPVELLVLEGVGCGARRYAALTTVLVWVWVPAELRLARGLERDGLALAPQWGAWMRSEDALWALEDPASRADVVVDGTGARPATLR